MHTAASVDIEDLPLGLNKIYVELLSNDFSQQGPHGSGGLRDEVIFFVRQREEEDEEHMDEANSLRLLPPSGAIVIGRYFSFLVTRCCALWFSADVFLLLSTIQLSILSDVHISPSLVESLSARVDGQIFGHTSPVMNVPDEFHVIIEGLAVETGTGTGDNPQPSSSGFNPV